MSSCSDVDAAAYMLPLSPQTSDHSVELRRDASEAAERSSIAMLAKLRALRGTELEIPINRPLALLDLPVDVLNEIIGHLPHANDLTALALSHSILHSLTIPSIYSRFDIVWPEQGMQSEARAGVDALTYGLATLVKSQEVFGEAAFQRTGGHRRRREPSNDFRHLYPVRRRRLGNYYAHYTKKFSLGNGPSDCVKEYLITKEGGKMLGTLVALALARMKSLEAFVWDMPTGILRDVWLALSALDDREDEEEHKLEKLWIRWHNNWQTDYAETPPPPPPPTVPPPNLGQSHRTPSQEGTIPVALDSNMLPLVDRVEHPSFSVVPALKSLTVLEIDELVYLDEMAILIARSSHILKELRVGVARHTRDLAWTKNWEGPEYQQVDHNTTWTIASKISEKRLQGVLGVLIGRMHNLRNNAETVRIEMGIKHLARVQERMQQETRNSVSSQSVIEPSMLSVRPVQDISVNEHPFDAESFPPMVQEYANEDIIPRTTLLEDADSGRSANFSSTAVTQPEVVQLEKSLPLRPAKQLRAENHLLQSNGPFLNGVLRLNVLELERVYLSLPVFRAAFDFTTITGLTLINCQNYERLWRDLRTRYAPSSQMRSRRHISSSHGGLNLKNIHTDTPSSGFLKFVRETLPPNTLESLFLQDRWGAPVSISAIFSSAIMRHRSSLKRLLIDSSQLEEKFTESSNRWRKWRLTRSMVAYITSGKMASLRELAVNIDYADWHVFLQRLFRVHTLRSLYIPHIADHPNGNNIDTHELALQIVDIITLRPEIELCYMGLGQKCFEILENKRPASGDRNSMSSDDSHPSSTRAHAGNSGLGRESDAEAAASDDEFMMDGPSDNEFGSDSTTSDDDDEDVFRPDRNEFDERHDGLSESDEGALSDDENDDASDDSAGCGYSSRTITPKLRLQEILFYDKIAIFKARHGRL